MKLELKHLAPYLPYGLKGLIKDNVVVLDTLHQHSLQTVPSIRKFTWCAFQNFKPILRPLSDLTKEIEVGGKVFIPIEIILGDWNSMLAGGDEYTIKDLPKNTAYMESWIVDYLTEWHFDVFGLIEEGLAVDINTIS